MRPVKLVLFLAPLLSCCRAETKPVDCSDFKGKNVYRYNTWDTAKSQVQTIYPFSERFSIQAYCDIDEDGQRWTVFQRRMDGTVNFYRGWDQYVAGFGDVDGEHWLGLEFIHRITARRPHELLVVMEDFEGNNASAHYSSFSVGGECDGYKLSVSGFTDGGAGDSLTQHNGMRFTTFDKDQDLHAPTNCAKLYYGGFWYNNCHHTNPNGVYLWGADSTHGVGINWNTWKGWKYSLKSLTMKIRPVS